MSYGRIDNTSNKANIIGGIVGNLFAKVFNSFSGMEIISSNKTKIGAIAGSMDSTYSSLTNCFYHAGLGADNASPSNGLKTSLGAATSSTSSVFSTDNTTLSYNGTLCEVLNAYRTERQLTSTYKEWIVGEDGWPTFAE